MPRPPGCIVSTQARLEPNRNTATHVDQRLPERGVAPRAESPLRKRNNLHHGNTMATLPKKQFPRVLLLSDVAPPGERAQDVQSGVISSRSVRRFMFPCTHGAPSAWAACLEAPSIRGFESPARGHHRHETQTEKARLLRACLERLPKTGLTTGPARLRRTCARQLGERHTEHQQKPVADRCPDWHAAQATVQPQVSRSVSDCHQPNKSHNLVDNKQNKTQ